MENTQSIYIESINETWEMPDELALKLTEYKNDHTDEANDADALHLEWYKTLSDEERGKIDKHTPQE